MCSGWAEVPHHSVEHNIPTVIPGPADEDVPLSRPGDEDLGPEDSADFAGQAQQYREALEAHVRDL